MAGSVDATGSTEPVASAVQALLEITLRQRAGDWRWLKMLGPGFRSGAAASTAGLAFMRGALRAPVAPDQERGKTGNADSGNEFASLTKAGNQAPGCKASDQRRGQGYCAADGAGACQAKNEIKGLVHGCCCLPSIDLYGA